MLWMVYAVPRVGERAHGGIPTPRRRGVAAARKALIGVGGIARYRRAAGVTRRFAPHPPRLPPNSRNIGHLASGLLPPPQKKSPSRTSALTLNTRSGND